MKCAQSKRTLCAAVICVAALAAGCTFQAPLLRLRYDKLHEETVEPSERWIELNKIALINVDGFIGEGGLLSPNNTTAADIKEKLKRAKEDSLVRGVLLRIDSPGGDVTTCDIIYNEVRAFSEETHKPVVAYLMSVAASGGYYVAISADRIVANPTTVTGSVGVIMEFTNAQKLWDIIGLQTVPVKSGEKKDMGSPFRPISPEEMAIFQRMDDEMFRGFMDKVQARRQLNEDSARTISDGRVVTGPEALSLGLVDQLGEMKVAIDEVKRLAGIGHADVVAYRAYPSHNNNVYASFESREQARPKAIEDVVKALAESTNPRFLYLWAPGR